ncbi:acetyltransferase [Saprospiraceae bacterium]|nr:acetyltransferase [Saprospiraceae bacterium]
MSEKAIILFGSGSPLIVDYEEVCRLQKIKISAVVNNVEGVKCQASSEVRQVKTNQVLSLETKLFISPLFTPYNRNIATNEAIDLGLEVLPYLIDSSALLPSNIKCGKGVFINKGVIIGASSVIGNHVLINRGATLGHHLRLEDYVSIGPGVTTGGNVTIGRGSMIGTGATILPTINIGKHAIIGAGSVVTKDVENNGVVVGNPARKIKSRNLNF